MPKISIIVPVYNVEKYLSRCVNSILSQTFKDFELILVDDGSPDKCPQICDEYASKDSRVSALHKKNAGQSSARNSALDIVTGDYIAFVDSDDWIAPDTYEYLYNLITKNDADVVSGDYVITYGNEIDFSKKYTEKVITGSQEILKFYFKQDKLHGKNDFPVWIKLYKKELFDGIRFPSGKIYEDNITNFLILSKCNKYVKSTKEVYAYFQRQQSTTKTKLTEKHLALIDVSKEMLDKVQNYDEELKTLVEKKIAMSYFSILTMYVRYGTTLDSFYIRKLVDEYNNIKDIFLKQEKSCKIHLLSFLMCTNIKVCRKIFKLKSKINI